MPDTIPQHFTTEFSTNWIHRTQQQKSRLDAFVESESFTGERKRYDRIAASTSRTRTERSGDTPVGTQDMDFRWAYRVLKDIPAKLLDPSDAQNLGALVLPNSDMIKANSMEYNRSCDQIALAAALGNVMTGELGATALALPAAQKIAKDTTSAATSLLTLAKLLAANEILNDADLEDDAMRVITVRAKDITSLLNTTEVKNVDYNTVKALAMGQIDTFMGFKFIKIKTQQTVSTTCSLACWVRGAIKVIKGGMRTTINVRPDKSNATQIYSQWDLGSTRVYDEGVVQIDVTA